MESRDRTRWAPGAVPALLLACAACAADRPSGAAGWIAERDTIGDTMIVRTVAGSVWGAPATLVEEISIGVLEGPEELMFGQVQAIAPDAQGGVYIFDGQVPALRYYDAAGNYVRTLGRDGSGPGEYRDVALGLAVRRDGRVVMRDPRNARINVYAPDGTPSDHWPVASGLFTSNAMRLDTADHIYLKILMERPERNKPWRIGLLHLDASGEFVDTIPDPRIAGEPETAPGVFAAEKVWAWSPLAYMVVGVNGRYAFELRPTGGPVVRIERSYEPVELHPAERAQWEARADWRRQYRAQFLTAEIPPVPDTKPAYRSISVGERGRIWVQRHVAAEEVEPAETVEPGPDQPPAVTWREPTVFDVFEPDGTYLGEVQVPRRTRLLFFRGDRIWGIRRGELDEQYVVRYRLRPPAAEPPEREVSWRGPPAPRTSSSARRT